ncbi:MAG: hypothetical protein CVU33_03170 [Betaproteobacteria bacterium HGW-Betaproteobacteria-6]|jgi:hypothetical protein|nr:MAG: hypothetical protein CVU33_03170 [Betaproteobacteria bacterium HGW-Betaproteobacteria-6]
MDIPHPFRFRLQFAARQPHKLPFPELEVQVKVSEGLTFEIAARNAESLDGATSFHIDATGFESAEKATLVADALRVRLRLLNAVLGLGLNIPVGDKVSAQVSEEIKNKLKSEQGATVVDSVWGASVFPDDGHHFEYVISGNVVVRPSSPEFLLEGIKILWNLDISLDKPSEDALQILCLATQETSDKAAFLTSYLALEELIERRPRSDIAREVLQHFVKELNGLADDTSHPLQPEEASSLVGTFRALSEESFSSALVRLGKQISQPTEICGMPIPKFLSACIDARNKIAHHAEPETKVPLVELSKSLREFVLMLIWTRNKLPNFTLNTPPSAVNIPQGGLSIRVM